MLVALATCTIGLNLRPLWGSPETRCWIAPIASDDAPILAHHANPVRLKFREWHRLGLGSRTITQLFAIMETSSKGREAGLTE